MQKMAMSNNRETEQDENVYVLRDSFVDFCL